MEKINKKNKLLLLVVLAVMSYAVSVTSATEYVVAGDSGDYATHKEALHRNENKEVRTLSSSESKEQIAKVDTEREEIIEIRHSGTGVSLDIHRVGCDKDMSDGEDVKVLGGGYTEKVAEISECLPVEGYISSDNYAKAYGLTYPTDKEDTIYDALTENEINYLCRMVETETYCAPFISKVYVAEVALHRLESYEGANMVGIITSPNQFCYSRSYISQDTIWAVEYAYKYKTEAQNAFGFQCGYTPKWYAWVWLFTDPVGHNFYGYDYENADILSNDVDASENSVGEM